MNKSQLQKLIKYIDAKTAWMPNHNWSGEDFRNLEEARKDLLEIFDDEILVHPNSKEPNKPIVDNRGVMMVDID